MKNLVFEVMWIDKTTSIIEGTDVFQAITNHFGEFYQQFYLTHKEIPYEKAF